MKTPFKKLRGLGLHRHDKRDRQNTQRSILQLDELSQASQDMQDMRDCYDSLLSAAAATANSAYEFSESLREMGGCLLEKTALNDDEDSGRVLLMLGKLQFEIQKLVDNYRSHISRTITVPSESLLNELRIVEDMQRQCEEKRMSYEEMKIKYKEKGKLKNCKGECISSHQLQAARDEFDEDATLFVFRMKSLKRGQSRSLLTQAARHHAAQMCFFRKALKSLEAIEPHVKLVTEKQHIDYQFSGLEDDDRDSVFLTDDEDEEGDEDDSDDGELSFDNRRNDQKTEVSSPGNSPVLDKEEVTFPQEEITFPQVASVKANIDRKPLWNSSPLDIDLNAVSKSAPLSAESIFNPSGKFTQMRQSSTRKLNTYVLPTPLEKIPVSSRPETQSSPQQRPTSTNMWHSSPLEHKKFEKILGNKKFSGPIASNTQSVLKESNINSKLTPLPPPLKEVQLDRQSASSAKKVKRYAFSGPLTSNTQSNKPLHSASGPIGSTGHPQLFSGSFLRTPLTRPSSTPKLSSYSLGSFVSSPKISELHELPRPPAHLGSKKSSKVGFSAPLVTFKSTNKSQVSSNAASTLPTPPGSISRSQSIPSRSQNQGEIETKSEHAETQDLRTAQGIDSPPLTPKR